MPLIYWFTQPQSSAPPEGRFSSYYLYDTGTKKFCRIRLALGRSTASASKGETNVSYHPDRAVGFAADSLPKGNWSVNDKFELCYNNNPLKPVPPPADYRTYDGTVTTSLSGARTLSDFHPGSVVTVKPKMLPGIEPKYLALLANDALINKSVYTLSAADATDVDLAKVIEGHVVRVLKVQSFGDVSDELILNTLKEQVKAISGDATAPAQVNLNKALDAVKSTNALISKQLESGSVPNEQLETAFSELQSALTSADNASRTGSVPELLAQINKAQEAVRTALSAISGGQQGETTTLLENANQSLTQAEQGARDWQTVDTDYRPLTDASNIDNYMKILSGSDAT